MRSIAHIRESDNQIQTVEEHLLGVKALAESYGEKLEVKHLTGLAGMLHDLGKYTRHFRDYILAAASTPSAPPKRGSVDHSTAGGRLLYELFHISRSNPCKGIVAEVVGNAIISHHSYLHDFLSIDLESAYLQRVRDKKCPELDDFESIRQAFFGNVMSEEEFHDYVEKAAAELERFLMKPTPVNSEAKLMFLTKFVFSALIDADRTNTRIFEANRPDEPAHNNRELFNACYVKLMNKIQSFKEQPETKSAIHLLRSEMSEQCEQFAVKPSGIYTLSIPTGGGKTLASFRYALKHASVYGKKRIIYVVPYTTIIEQNAEEIRKIVGDEAVVIEHHSNVIEDTLDDDENQDGLANTQQKAKLAKDNWDAPIIFTTMVQFLNVFYAYGSRNSRRLHNLCESVIIFDEVQKVPISCVSLFNQALNFLKAYGQSSIVLCTATQPALDFVKHKLDINLSAEMIGRLDDVIDAFKRVEVIDKATEESFTNAKLVDFIETAVSEDGVNSVLIILNTKAVVKDLYRQLKTRGSGIPVYHLSTSMCAAHRSEILEEVKGQLSVGNKVICISTQLIEAGVDISFDCVIRSLAGLDSIAQAAGRCNRHGKKGIQRVYVIDHAEESLSRLKEIKVGKEMARKILKDLKRDSKYHGGNILSRRAMERYFKEFYTEFETDLNYSVLPLRKSMMELLTSSREYNDKAYKSKTGQRLPLFIANSYRTAAEHFHVIDDRTTSVVVPYGKGEDIIAELNGDGTIDDLTRLLRSAQHYTISLYDHELRELDRSGGLDRCLDGKVLVLKERAYSGEFGLDIENDSSMGMLIM
ncbi:hypothetical protein PAESOLCIP111_03074 [Paenibacillus solanacearum]|uniref:CRISPR-associated helicase Cas3 n=1 Tax=Paenibacillus solanacearum TaxID=2048548 RepID=A0A916NJ48_9BACL|nr:CRISPR-associated helicase Cas3' [Paenibacillus solanacearum]CAG7629147.1 hypothetical protein PAESOLCIP111_03074 [Paenibacillus solanacearum]